jgi:hypothetical protein
LHWGVFYIFGKVLKCKCPKWLRMSHLDIFSTSYGWKKGREPNWQFDFRSLKVGNRPDPGVCDTRLERSQGELQVCFRPHPNRRSEREVMNAQSFRSPNWDNFGTPLWESREKMSFGCKCNGKAQRILYGGRWWLPLSLGRDESNEFKVGRGLS